MVALDDVSLDVHPGERLALVGENGAGKSSLMNVLYGLYHPDAGEVRVGARPVRLRSPRDAIALGIGMVHQHFMLVPSLTVAENVVLGNEPTRFGFLDRAAARDAVARTADRFGFRLDPAARVADLTVGAQQKVEIVKALHRGARTLILDEPTAVLTPQEVEELFSVIHQLSAAGHAVVVISHKLREVLAIATRVAVMRRGRLVAERLPAETSAAELAELMVGERAAASMTPPAVSPASGAPDAGPGAGVPTLQLRGLSAFGRDGRAALVDVTLEVGAGEVVGVAGVDGNGQRELAEVLTGLRPWHAGEVRLGGELLRSPTPGDLRGRGVGHVPEDRLQRAVVGAMTVEENVALGRQVLPPFTRGPWIDFAGRRERTERLIRDYDLRPPDPTAVVAGLSGGNQQKLVVARELDARPRLLVVVQPTRGLDVAAVAAVHERLRAERARGCAVLLISLDLEELLHLSDRLYVVYEGRLQGELPRARFDEREIGRRMLGAQPEVSREGAA